MRIRNRNKQKKTKKREKKTHLTSPGPNHLPSRPTYSSSLSPTHLLTRTSPLHALPFSFSFVALTCGLHSSYSRGRLRGHLHAGLPLACGPRRSGFSSHFGSLTCGTPCQAHLPHELQLSSAGLSPAGAPRKSPRRSEIHPIP